MVTTMGPLLLDPKACGFPTRDWAPRQLRASAYCRPTGTRKDCADAPPPVDVRNKTRSLTSDPPPTPDKEQLGISSAMHDLESKQGAIVTVHGSKRLHRGSAKHDLDALLA